MSRKIREWYQGAIFHVMARGIRRQAIFKTEEDYYLFQKIIETALEQLDFRVFCYCFMTNHFHILLKTGETEIWKVMNRIMSSYARMFNQKYGYTGHLFDSRYVSRLVEDNIYLAEASRYIHLNPVRAGMVREPQDYQYSSYQYYIGMGVSPILELDQIQKMFMRNPEEEYRRFVESAVSHKDMEMLIQKDMKEDDNWLPW